MLSQDGRLSSHTDSSRRGFTNLYLFLRDAFQQKGLVSISPEILQIFKECPLQDIECPDIAAFAKLFDGSRSKNKFRLEANSFVYTVQILFHLRPNLVQERVLHLLMVSVRLLKDEKAATQQLSELAGREIGRYAVARKRVTITTKLVPWLLKHFAHESTILRLKIIAAQFLFHLLQGDEEAKKVLASAQQKDCSSLGKAVIECPHFPLRILAANVLREVSLAGVDVRSFCPAEILDDNGLRLPSSFIADAQWLRDTVRYLGDVDDLRTTADESRTKIYEICFLKFGPFAFSDFPSKTLATVSEQLLFVIPAHQNRPLQILEVPLVANMDYRKGEVTISSDDTMSGRVELQLQLRNTGFYILNGTKGAVDQVQLSFATEDECNEFCQAITDSLLKLPTRFVTPSVWQSDIDKEGSKPRPKKQSRAVMIDLSQDDIVNGDTQLLPQPLKAPQRVSTSQRIDMSMSGESSMSPLSPPRDRTAKETAPIQPEDVERIGDDAGHIRHELHHHSMAIAETNLHNREKAEVILSVNRLPDKEKMPEDLIAPARSDSTGQGEIAQSTKPHLPQQMEKRGLAETKISSPIATSNLQHLALDALQHSAGLIITTTSSHTDPIANLDEPSRRTTADQPKDTAPPPLLLSTLANLSKRISPKQNSNNQAASTAMPNTSKENEKVENKSAGSLVKRFRAANVIPERDSTVDWDEDLRVNEDEQRDQSKLVESSKASAFGGTRTGPKQTGGTKTAPRASGHRKKTAPKDKVKGHKKQASVNAGLAATRPRRAAASVSYDEQSGEEERSQTVLRKSRDTSSHAETDQSPAPTPSPNINNDRIHLNKQLAADKNTSEPVESPAAELHAPIIPTAAEVEVSRRIEAVLAPFALKTKLGNNDVKNDASPPDRVSFRGQRGRRTGPGQEFSERIETPEVEAVDNSHAMDKIQHADAISGARKSFGSALMDVMSGNGMQPIKSPHVSGARTKPFGNKAAFVDSVKSTIKQSPRKPPILAPSSSRRIQAQTPFVIKQEGELATRQGPLDQTTQSAGTTEANPREGSMLHRQLGEGGEVVPLLQITKAAMPTATSDRLKLHETNFSLPQQGKSGSDQIRPTEEIDEPLTSHGESLSFPQERRSDDDQAEAIQEVSGPQGKDININAPSSHSSMETPKPSGKTDFPNPFLSPSDKAANMHNDKRKRRPPPEIEKPQETKWARKSDLGPKTNQLDDKRVQTAPLLPQTSVSIRARNSRLKPRISEPSARGVKSVALGDAALAVRLTEQAQKTPQTCDLRRGDPEKRSSETDSKLIQPKAQTSKRHLEVGHSPRLTDDHLHRKTQIVGFSATGPRNQGVSSSGERGHATGQNGSVPTETGKYLAFKKLHTEPKAVEHPEKAVPNPFNLFGHGTKRKVEFQFSDRESSDDGLYVDEESAGDAAPAIMDLENGKSASQTSKVDENGSPRLNLRKVPRVSRASNVPTAFGNPHDPNECVDTTSAFESSESDGRETDQSAEFSLSAAVTKYTADNTKMTAKLKVSRSRPSIGVGKLLDQSFPQASKKIETTAFKAPALADKSASTRPSHKPDSTDQPNHDQILDQPSESEGRPEDVVPIDRDETPLFDIDQMNVSVANERPISTTSPRVRRVRSSTSGSPCDRAPERVSSPLSFNTRLGKMIMPPPPRKGQPKVETSHEFEAGRYVGREQSAMMDAETTLVNGEAFEEQTDLSSPQSQQGSSSSASEGEEGAAVSASQQAPTKALHSDRRFWNQKVAETKQTIQEILEQVSQKFLMRFSTAEAGIKFKLDHYHYGGWQIVNNFVQQFDQRVSQEKEATSPRMGEHHHRLEEAVKRLEQAKQSVQARPSLDDLEKSRNRRSEYVLANLHRFAAAQRS